MFKSLDSIASVVGICMYLTISKCKQVLKSRKDGDSHSSSIQTILFLYCSSLDITPCHIFHVFR